ncbi:MAG: hypothetical protein A2075_17135 [Geobacteraceae bacterium GWC2_58_44]|nr:MAG: hypothetical protein A2075_17135 [Geobacteraceae bacterium GWC2_58_44]HBG04228.1 hypothetical protein [Geobacter sp.]
MKCTCPKCRGKIELDLPEVTEEGTSASCPACKAHFTVRRESFGGRALRKSGEISCAYCGNELGPQMHCPTCGQPFPEYLVAALGRKKARAKGPKIKIKSSPFKKYDKMTSQLPTLDSAMAQEGLAASKQQGLVAAGPPKKIVIAAVVLVLVALIAAGAGFYSKKKAETAYMKNFARATYGIQVGADMSRRVCQKVAAEWKVGIEAGRHLAPRPGIDEEKELNSIKTKLDSIKSKCSREPEKFKDCNQKLAKMEATYHKMQALALAPGNSLPGFTDSLNRIEVEYKQATNEFKTGLPDELMEELHSAAKKYRELRPLLK